MCRGAAGEASTGTRTSTNRFFRIVSVAEMEAATRLHRRPDRGESRDRRTDGLSCVCGRILQLFRCTYCRDDSRFLGRPLSPLVRWNWWIIQIVCTDDVRAHHAPWRPGPGPHGRHTARRTQRHTSQTHRTHVTPHTARRDRSREPRRAASRALGLVALEPGGGAGRVTTSRGRSAGEGVLGDMLRARRGSDHHRVWSYRQ